MNSLLEDWTAAVAHALGRHGVAVQQAGPRRWAVTLADAEKLSLQACLTPEWLLFDAPLPAGLAAALPARDDVFAVNAVLPASLRLCTAGLDPRLRLRAEMPVLEDRPVAQRVDRICRGITAVASWLAAGAVDALRPPRLGPAAAASVDCDLHDLCRASGWTFTARDGNAAVVELDVRGAFQQATVEHNPDQDVVVSLPVLGGMPAAEPCAAAVARLLLGLSGAVRTVSAIAHGSEPASKHRVDLQVRFVEAPAGEELAHAFAALSVAWRCGGREAEVLARDERVARLYAAIPGDQQSREGLSKHTT